MDPFTKGAIIGMLIGLLFGGTGGAMAMAVLSYNRRDDDDDEVEEGPLEVTGVRQ